MKDWTFLEAVTRWISGERNLGGKPGERSQASAVLWSDTADHAGAAVAKGKVARHPKGQSLLGVNWRNPSANLPQAKPQEISMHECNWAVVVPMANEEEDFEEFVFELAGVLNKLESGTVYAVVDTVSRDQTLQLCEQLSKIDRRFVTIWAPENRNVVDAYLCGLREAYNNGHDIIIEMDAGMSHDPKAIPLFLSALKEGCVCAFGSRFINGGSMGNSPLKRKLLSYGGTVLANLLLGTRLYDMTSGYQGFHSHVIANLLKYPLLSTGHFYQTEVRYLVRNYRYAEIPIRYRAPSPRVSRNAIRNALKALLYYFTKRLVGKAIAISRGNNAA